MAGKSADGAALVRPPFPFSCSPLPSPLPPSPLSSQSRILPHAHSPAQTLPVIPSRNRVLLPGSALRLKIGRPASVRLVEECIAPLFASAGSKGAPQALVAVVALDGERAEDGDPTPAELHTMGCVGRVFRCEKVTEDSEVRYILVVEGNPSKRRDEATKREQGAANEETALIGWTAGKRSRKAGVSSALPARGPFPLSHTRSAVHAAHAHRVVGLVPLPRASSQDSLGSARLAMCSTRRTSRPLASASATRVRCSEPEPHPPHVGSRKR